MECVEVTCVSDPALLNEQFDDSGPSPSMFMAFRLTKCSMRPNTCGGHVDSFGQ